VGALGRGQVLGAGESPHRLVGAGALGAAGVGGDGVGGANAGSAGAAANNAGRTAAGGDGGGPSDSDVSPLSSLSPSVNGSWSLGVVVTRPPWQAGYRPHPPG
jgi:hypothetical protein